jgi:hypothetical protein
MEITLHPTTRIVDVETPTGVVPARVWEGRTASGIQVVACITRIAVHKDQDHAEFERELAEQRPPGPHALQAFPARLVL